MLLASFPLAAWAAESRAGSDRVYRLTVEVQTARSAVTGALRFPVAAGVREELAVGALAIQGVSVNGKDVDAGIADGMLSFLPPSDGVAEIRYEGTFASSEPVGERNYGVVTSVIDRRGVSLTGLWHPRPAGPARWQLSASLPRGYEAVSEAETLSVSRSGDRAEFVFDFPHPLEALSLVASDRFHVLRERAGNVELLGYFFKEDQSLAAVYLEHARKYLALYEKMLTPYPYKRFAVVENFLPTGYSLPTYTLLGQDVVRLPFIVETSLGHEILHQWFGNSVYVDDREGNWAEGLTAYLADHWYDELNGKGWEHRKQLLLNFGAYVDTQSDIPLKDFRSRMDRASRAIGYGKAALVVHQLRRLAGDESFFDALRTFIRAKQFDIASWSDLRSAFEKRTGRDLKPYFNEWLGGKGLPELGIENLNLRRTGGGFEIAFDVTRKNSALPAVLPVKISFLRGGETTTTITIDENRKRVKLTVGEEPSTAVLDGDYDVLRRLTDDETPPLVAAATGARKPLVVTPAAGFDRAGYAPVIAAFTEKGGAVREAGTIKDADLRSVATIILGRDNPVAARLFGSVDLPEKGFSIMVRKNPWNARLPVAIVQSSSSAETDAAFEKIFHYGKYSTLAFEKGRNTKKDIAESERGMILLLREEPAVLDLRTLRTFSAIVDAAADKRILYVGEYHDRFSHHTVQVELIKALYARNPSLAVGMEMFQRPFQKTLDEYIGGDIDEKTFLIRSEYFKRWGFDYHLYKPILDYCRTNRIPVVALNLRREITEKVSKGGMDSLTDEERRELPRETDFSDQEYRDRLKETFAQHRGRSEEKTFDFFLQSQILWDETMAESVADYLAKHPERKMVVVAGGGHLAYGSGIPRRVFRRNGQSYTIALNDGDLGPGVADFLIFPQSLDGTTAPKLMAMLKEEETRLVVTDLAKEGPARTAGIEAGDVLIALDGVPVASLQDLKLALFYRKPGDVLLVTVERKRFLFGAKVMTLEVTL